MDNFHRIFHEPFYRDYIKDDISTRIEEAGFEKVTANSFFMTRVWTAFKPLDSKKT